MNKKIIYRAKTVLLYLFVFSLPFEYWDPFGVASFFTVTKFAGLFYFILSLIHAKLNFNVKYTYPPLRLLLTLWVWLGFQSLLGYWTGTTFSPFNFTLLQNIMLFWLVSNDIIHNRHLIKRILFAFICGVIMMTLLASLGVGLALNQDIGEGRLTFFGSNSNTVGVYLSMSFTIIIIMIFNRQNYFRGKTFLLLLSLPSMLTMIGLTGSRGALVIVAVGLVFFFITYKTSLVKRILILSGGLLVFVFSVQKILESEIMQSRLDDALSGNSAGRDMIWDIALNIFFESPLSGHGATGYEYLMIQNNSGTYMDTHNLFLYLMVTGGIVALMLFVVFLIMVYKSALFIYKINGDSIMLILLAVYLFNVSKAGGIINAKAMWLMLSLIYSYKYSLIFASRKLTPSHKVI